jgi:hypothetical protein
MLEIRGGGVPGADGVSRRGFLKVGSLGLAGLTLEALLGARRARATPAGHDTSVILFWMAGGPSHIDTYDMKPDAPEQVRGPFCAVRTSLPGYRMCELMPRQARLAHRLAVIRSLHHTLGEHDDASHWVQTGYPLVNARQRGQLYPAQGAVVSYLRGGGRDGMPAYVCIPEGYNSPRGFYQSAAYLPPRHNPVNAGGDPALGNYRPPDFTLPADLTLPRLEHRRELSAVLDRAARWGEGNDRTGQMSEVRREAYALLTGQRARRAFDLSREPLTLRDRYGRHAYGQSALLARRLVEAGVGFVTINLYEADVDWWDDHYHIERNLRVRLPRFDQALGTLLEDLHDRGLADRVLVAAFGEFGRTPTVDQLGGRSHWPRAMTAVLTGGGLRGGRLVGSTTSNGGEPRDNPLGPGDLLATIYHAVGIDHEAALPDRQNRPVRLVEPGAPIRELF